jgi:hypothetical protein
VDISGARSPLTGLRQYATCLRPADITRELITISQAGCPSYIAAGDAELGPGS